MEIYFYFETPFGILLNTEDTKPVLPMHTAQFPDF